MATKRRSEGFLGLHFDFHAAPAPDGSTPPIGGRVTELAVEEIIDAFGPDYIQCDCKGHPGYSSYPTRAGNPYPNIEGDPLRVWRRATARRGVALVMHYSGVIDEHACRTHPEWAAVRADGTPHEQATSTFGPYADELLIPQLKELAGEYGVDGIWLDGECWGTAMDYCDAALRRFERETGIRLDGRLPVPGDEHFEAYKALMRRRFVEYLNHYIAAVRVEYPDFEIASNWAYSAEMPQAVDAPVDFLSGDYSPGDSYNSARFHARCLAPQGKPWDLMAWGFRHRFDRPNEQCPKHVVQLMQEAAAVLMMGGGFQCYINLPRDGAPRVGEVRNLRALAQFCRARQPWCHGAQAVPQAVLLNSTADHDRRIEKPFASARYESIQGLTQLFLETQQSLEIRAEHNLTGQMERWPLIAVPEVLSMDDSLRDELLRYADKGGSLLLVGPGAVRPFAEALGLAVRNEDAVSYLSSDGDQWSVQVGANAVCAYPAGTQTVGRWAATRDDGAPSFPAAGILRYGRGLVACLPVDVGAGYRAGKTAAARALFRALCAQLYTPTATVEGSQYADMALMRKDGKTYIHLINTAGGHGDPTLATIDEIPPIGPLTIRITCPAPVRVTRWPDGDVIPCQWADGACTLTLPRLELYDILALE